MVNMDGEEMEVSYERENEIGGKKFMSVFCLFVVVYP